MNSEWTITSPYTPKIKDNKLYGRGVARGGSLFMILGIIKAMQSSKIPHPKFSILFDCGGESGCYYLKLLLETLKNDIGTPDYIFSL